MLRYWQVFFSILSGCLYSLPYIFPNFFFFSWFAWVPFLFAIQNQSYKKTYLLSLLCGASAYAIGMYWMANLSHFYFGFPTPFHYLFLLFFAVIAAHFFCCTFLLLQFFKEYTRFSELFLFPLCFVFLSFYNPLTFHTAFGSTQAFFLSAIQAIEFTGIETLSFLLAFFNIFCYKVFSCSKEIKKRYYLLFFTIFVLWFSYGAYSSKRWEYFYTNWEKINIAIVQPNRVASFSNLEDLNFSKDYPLEFFLMENIAKKNPLFTIWPEGYTYHYQNLAIVRDVFQASILSLKTHLLFIDNHYLPNGVYNSMFWLDNQGVLKDIYHKRSLVPFGEYLPFQDYYAFFLKWVGFSFGRFQEGKEAKIFSIDNVQVAPLICYESLVGYTAAESIGENGKGKIFVLSTNNGWYRSRYQVITHSIISNLRAVENRVPLIHTINNGYSSVVMPNGEVIFQTPYLKAGAWVFALPYSKKHGGTFYSKNPFLFKRIITIFFFLVFFVAIFSRLEIVKIRV